MFRLTKHTVINASALRQAVIPALRTPRLARTITDKSGNRVVTVANGDGIGPEIMGATLDVLKASGAKLSYEFIDIGEQVYRAGNSSGIGESAWESLARTQLFLKAPITTPLGGGVKSLNVTCRKTLGLFANVRPVNSYHPYVKGLHEKMDVVIVRENEEDLYAGIEHRHTSEVLQCIKLISIPGSERIIRYAFEYARSHGRKKVTCVTKNNIMKLTDGAFADVFKHVAKEYPDLESNHMIVDIATARVASRPQDFDVLVTLNLYGDIISDVAAEVCGSVGLCGSANIGNRCSMFEAVHGSAPDLAGKNVANPSGLINAAVLMLSHLGDREQAIKIKNGLLCALEDGMHTADIFREGTSKQLCGTKEFGQAVIERLGQTPKVLRTDVQGDPRFPPNAQTPAAPAKQTPVRLPLPSKTLVGVDIFVDWEEADRNPDVLADTLNKAQEGSPFKLLMLSNRGVKVWPNGHPDTYKVNHWRCRFMMDSGHETVSNSDIVELMKSLQHTVDTIKTENLYDYSDGQPGYSLGQGQ